MRATLSGFVLKGEKEGDYLTSCTYYEEEGGYLTSCKDYTNHDLHVDEREGSRGVEHTRGKRRERRRGSFERPGNTWGKVSKRAQVAG